MFYLIFDEIRSIQTAKSIAQAINITFKYLGAVIQTYLDSEAESNESVRIVAFEGASKPKSVTKAHVKHILTHKGMIELYLESSEKGVFHTACIVHQDLYDTPEEKQSRMHREKIDTIKEFATHDHGDNYLNWTPSEVNPISILHAAEERIFSTQLFKYCQKAPLQLERIDKEAGFVEGTVERMLNAIEPLRPTKKMVDILAKILHVKPTDLWVDLVPYYLDKSGKWDEFVNASLQELAEGQ